LTKSFKNEKNDLRRIIVFLILIALSVEEASAATTTYYFKNNGTSSNIRYTTTNRRTVYDVYRFYRIPNITAYTEIGAKITGRVGYWGTSTTGKINVSISDYNPADGSRIKYGESTNITTRRTAQTNYNFKIDYPTLNISAGHKVVAYANVTTPTTGSMGSRR
jgi:hypothetical protein